MMPAIFAVNSYLCVSIRHCQSCCQLGHPPAAINYNIVLKMVASAGEWALAEELFQEMEGHPHTSGAQPDNFTFSTLISCCVRWVTAPCVQMGTASSFICYFTPVDSV